jgi:probable F420-dependent oxidoreductase
MKIGIFNYHSIADKDPALLAQRAEEFGFDAFWLREHPIIPAVTSGPVPDVLAETVDPFIALARASAVTKTIKLGTSICVVPEHNPLLLAKAVATLDHFSGGRLLFGIGAGFIQEGSKIMGVDWEHRWTQTREAIMAMKALWTTEEAEYHGRYYDFPPVRSFPKPAQQPHPPLLLGGRAKNLFKRIVAYGDGWLLPYIPPRSLISPEQIRQGRETLNELARQAGRDPASIQVVAFAWLPEPDTLQAFEDAGADAVRISLETAGEKEALTKLEEIARTVLR